MAVEVVAVYGNQCESSPGNSGLVVTEDTLVDVRLTKAGVAATELVVERRHSGQQAVDYLTTVLPTLSLSC